MATKDEWKQTKAALDALKNRREEAVAEIRISFERECQRRWANTQTRYQNLKMKLDEIEGEIGQPIYWCEGCEEPIWDGDKYHIGADVALCENCAPSYGDMLSSPGNFANFDDEPMTAEEAKAIVDAHLAAGGSLTDKMV